MIRTKDLLVKERDGIEVALEIIEYFKSEQIVNKNTPFTTVDYDYAIDSIVNKNSLCKIRGKKVWRVGISSRNKNTTTRR